MKTIAFQQRAANGDFAVTHTRGVATIDPEGNAVAANALRYDRPVAVTGRPRWLATGVSVGSVGAVAIRTAGVLHDGTTPAMVIWNSNQQQFTFYSGTPFTLVRSVTLAQIKTALGAPSAQSFDDAFFDLHHGLFQVAINREDSGDLDGVTLAVTQDMGATWQYRQVYDASGTAVTASASVGIGDVPRITLTGGDTIAQVLNDWALCKFPVAGYSPRRRIRQTVVDYQSKSGNPGGYQVMVMEDSRDSDTGLWTVGPARLIYQTETAGESGLHGHAAAATTSGVIVAVGDVDYRNRTDRHVFDWDNYATASVTSTVGWHGGTDLTAATSRPDPQVVAFVPWANGGSLGSADEGYAMTTYEDVIDGSDPPKLGRADWRHAYTNQGLGRAGHAPLHLRWTHTAYSQVWYGGSGDNTPSWYHLSLDGQHLARLHLRGGEVGDSGLIWSDGFSLYKLVAVGNLYTVWRAPIPNVAVMTPALIQPGSTNLARNDAWGTRTAPGGTGTMRAVYHDGTTYRYSSDDSALDPQPRVPPQGFGPIAELVYAGDSIEGGEFYVTPEDVADRVDMATANVVLLNVLPMGTAGFESEIRFRALNTGYADGSEGFRDWEVIASDRWTPLVFPTTFASERTETRGMLDIASRSQSANTVCRALVQVQWSSGTARQPYPIQPETETATGNERLVLAGLESNGGRWGVASVVGMVETFFAGTDDADFLFTLYADANNYVDVAKTTTTDRTDTVRVRVYSGGSLAGTATLDVGQSLPGEPMVVLVWSDGASTFVSVSTSLGTDEAEIEAAPASAPSEWRSGNHDGTSAACMRVFGVQSDFAGYTNRDDSVIENLTHALATNGRPLARPLTRPLTRSLTE